MGREAAAGAGAGGAVETGEVTAGLLDDDRDGREIPQRRLGVGGDLSGALGHQHVLPGIADAARPPAPAAGVDHLLEAADRVPPLDPAPHELRVAQLIDLRDVNPAAV